MGHPAINGFRLQTLFFEVMELMVDSFNLKPFPGLPDRVAIWDAVKRERHYSAAASAARSNSRT